MAANIGGSPSTPPPTFGQDQDHTDQKKEKKVSFVEQDADTETLTESAELKPGEGGETVPLDASLQKVIRKAAVGTLPLGAPPAVSSEIARIMQVADPIIKMQTGEIDVASIISQSTLGSPEAKVLLEFLISGTLPSAKDISVNLLKGLLISKDKLLLAEARNSLQKIFLGISEQLQEMQKHPPINPEQDKLYEILVGDLLTLYPFLEAHYEEKPVLTVPQKVGGKWTNVTYNVEAMELAKELKSTSPIYAYGLKPKDNDKASPLLLFMGTPPPTTTGADIAVWVDVIPEHTVGEALYKMSKKEIEDWVDSACQNSKNPVQTYGKSLGGAMCLLTSIHCGNKVVAHAYNPPGLHERMLKLHEEKYKEKPESERPVINVYSQEDDLVSELIGKWPEGTHYYKIMPHKEQKSSVPILGRYFAHIQSFLGKRVQVLELTIENVNKEDRRIAAASIVQFLCRLVLGGKTENIRQKVVGTYDWASIDTAEKLPDSSGKKRKRVDLTTLFNGGAPTDVNNHVHIALADDYTYPSVAPYIAGLGKVAVKIGVYQYIILNLESLSKRLGIPIPEIKEAEEKGTVDVLIQNKLKELKLPSATADSRIDDYKTALKKAEQNLRGRAGSSVVKNDIRTLVSDQIDGFLKKNPLTKELKEYLKFVRDLHLEKGNIDIEHITTMALANRLPPPDSLRETVCKGLLLHAQEKLKSQRRPSETKNAIRTAVRNHIDSVLAGTPKLEQLIDCRRLIEDLQLEKGKVAKDHIIRALRNQIPSSGPLRESLCTTVLSYIQEKLQEKLQEKFQEKLQKKLGPKASPVLLKVSKHIGDVLKTPSPEELSNCLELIGALHLDKGEVDIVHMVKALRYPGLPADVSVINELREATLELIKGNLTEHRGQNETKNAILDDMIAQIDQKKDLVDLLTQIGDLHLEKGDVDIDHITKTLANRIFPVDDPFRKTAVSILQAGLRKQLESGEKISSFLQVKETLQYRRSVYTKTLAFFGKLFKNEARREVTVLTPILLHAEYHIKKLLDQKNPAATEDELRQCLKVVQDFYFGEKVALGIIDTLLYVGNLVTLEHMAKKVANQILSPYTHDPQRMRLFTPLQQVIQEKIKGGAEVTLFEALQQEETAPCWLKENDKGVTIKELLEAAVKRLPEDSS